MTIARGFLAHAMRTPGRDAIVQDRPLSYADLRLGAIAVGRALTARFGPAPATPPTTPRIAVLLDNGPEFLEIFEGAALAGVPVMVLDPEWSAAELTAILTDVPPALLFCE